MPNQRLSELDALRGLAAVAVLWHHSLLFAGFLIGPFGQWLSATPLQPIRTGRPAVIFFFMLSGFVLTKALRNRGFALAVRPWAVWAAQRTIRLCLPVAGSVVISFMLYLAFYDGTWPMEEQWLRATVWQNPPTPMSMASQSLLAALDDGYALNNVLWSLVHEWRFSMLLPFVLTAPVFGRRGIILLVLTAMAASSLAVGAFGPTTYAGATAVQTARATLYFSLPFILGVALQVGDAAKQPADHWLAALGFTAVLGLCRNGTDYAVFTASAILIWLALQPGLLQRLLRHPALTALGAVSFSLYLTHVPVLAALHHGLHDRLSSAAICALGIAASLPAAWLFHKTIELPAHRLARCIERGRSMRG